MDPARVGMHGPPCISRFLGPSLPRHRQLWLLSTATVYLCLGPGPEGFIPLPQQEVASVSALAPFSQDCRSLPGPWGVRGVPVPLKSFWAYVSQETGVWEVGGGSDRYTTGKQLFQMQVQS